MKTMYLKKNKKYEYDSKNFHDCQRKCDKHCKKCAIGEYDWNSYKCSCYEESDQNDYDKIIFKIKNNKHYKVNKVAFWITFSFFMVFVAILIYFFIKIFFIGT